MPVGIGQGQAEQPLRADQKPRRVAAPPSQTGSCRDALREPRPDARASREKTRLAEQIPRALDHVGLRTGDRSSADLEFKAGRARIKQQLILQRHRLQDRVDLVIAVGSAAQEPEAEIHLGGAADPERGRVHPSGQARTRITTPHQSRTLIKVARSVRRSSVGFPPFSSAYMR